MYNSYAVRRVRAYEHSGLFREHIQIGISAGARPTQRGSLTHRVTPPPPPTSPPPLARKCRGENVKQSPTEVE